MKNYKFRSCHLNKIMDFQDLIHCNSFQGKWQKDERFGCIYMESALFVGFGRLSAQFIGLEK